MINKFKIFALMFSLLLTSVFTDSSDNAVVNLQKFGEVLKLELKFGDRPYHPTYADGTRKNTCIIGIDDKFSMYLSLVGSQLFIYSPLPSQDTTKSGRYAGKSGRYAGVLNEILLKHKSDGSSPKGFTKFNRIYSSDGIVMLEACLEMEDAAGDELNFFAPLYVETVEQFILILQDVVEGKTPRDFTLPGK